jgi:hypothetical protein
MWCHSHVEKLLIYYLCQSSKESKHMAIFDCFLLVLFHFCLECSVFKIKFLWKKWPVQQVDSQWGDMEVNVLIKVLGHSSVITNKWESSDSIHTKRQQLEQSCTEILILILNFSNLYTISLKNCIFTVCSCTRMHTSIINCKTIKYMQTYVLVTEHEQVHTVTHTEALLLCYTHTQTLYNQAQRHQYLVQT